MPNELLFPWISAGFVPLIAVAPMAWRANAAEQARRWAITALSLSALLFITAFIDAQRADGPLAQEPWGMKLFALDALNSIPLSLFTLLALGLTILAPKRKASPRWISGMVLLALGTCLAYAANNLLLLCLGWVVSSIPFLTGRFFNIAGEREIPRGSKIALAGSIVCLLIGVSLLAWTAAGALWIDALDRTAASVGDAASLRWAFFFLMAAVFLRKGLLPAHSWVLAAFERGPLLPLTLLINGHLGAFLIARLAIPMLPDIEKLALPMLGDLGLLTAGYTALLALVEKHPRRLLALLSISQSSFLLVGLESNNADGVAGALLHWQVVSVASAALASVYTGLEARLDSSPDGARFLGLASSAPRLAIFFLVSGLALVGLPLTLGFCAEDLLLHGALNSHPHLGVLLPIVTALNAFSVLRIFASLFLGRPGVEARGMVDALPRERLPLTAMLVFLTLGGIAPGPLVRFPAAAAKRLVTAIQTADPTITLH
jgi:NADH-quinone oxidoreductase subunit M